MKPAAKFDWLKQLASDRGLTPLALRLGVILGTTYVNTETGEAWPSHKTLMEELNAHPDALRRAALDLAGRGHMTFTPGRGKGVTSRYRPLLKPRDATGLSDAITPKKLGGDPTHQNPENLTAITPWGHGVNPYKETVEVKRAGRRASELAIPEGFPSQEAIARLAPDFPNIDLDREALTFRLHAETHDRRCANWVAAFRSWLVKAPAYAASRPQHHRNQNVDSFDVVKEILANG